MKYNKLVYGIGGTVIAVTIFVTGVFVSQVSSETYDKVSDTEMKVVTTTTVEQTVTLKQLNAEKTSLEKRKTVIQNNCTKQIKDIDDKIAVNAARIVEAGKLGIKIEATPNPTPNIDE